MRNGICFVLASLVISAVGFSASVNLGPPGEVEPRIRCYVEASAVRIEREDGAGVRFVDAAGRRFVGKRVTPGSGGAIEVQVLARGIRPSGSTNYVKAVSDDGAGADKTPRSIPNRPR